MLGKSRASARVASIEEVKLIHRVGLKFDASGVDLDLGFVACNALNQSVYLYIFPFILSRIVSLEALLGVNTQWAEVFIKLWSNFVGLETGLGCYRSTS